MRWSLTISVVAAVLLASCSLLGQGHWADEGIHVVDGYWITPETWCNLAPADDSLDDCAVAIRTARDFLGLAPEAIVRGWTAPPAMHWVRADGSVPLFAYGGLSQPRFAILDLADGARRVVPLICRGTVTTEVGGRVTVESPPSCEAYPLDGYRVGADPPVP